MKIYVLPLPPSLQPASQPFVYPAGNKDYGVEQDFHDWLHENPALMTDDPKAADFHYLPVFWTRYHLNHDYGRTGQDELAIQAVTALRDDAKTFTICQYDDGPKVTLGRTRLFLASRQTDNGIDIPLLRTPHRVPFWKPRKHYLASFLGRLATHPIRQKMADAVKGRGDILLQDGDQGAQAFVRTTLASHICLAPRGYGGSSFRAFEAMQLGVAPFVIGGRDTRPFRALLDWDACSLYTSDPAEIPALLAHHTKAEFAAMGRAARDMFTAKLSWRRWCPLVLEELKERA